MLGLDVNVLLPVETQSYIEYQRTQIEKALDESTKKATRLLLFGSAVLIIYAVIRGRK